MVILFYFFSFLSISVVMLMLINNNLIYILLYFVLFILSLSGMIFSLGSYFLGALEIIIYAGSIIVLFLFIIMLIDFNKKLPNNSFNFSFSVKDFFFVCFMLILVSFLCIQYRNQDQNNIFFHIVSVKDIGFCLFGKYCFLTELASFLLLSSVILVCFFVKNNKYNNFIINKGSK